MKTDEYKKRSQGSYFSRDYLDLLEQKQLELLEAASDSVSLRSSCDACSICYGSGSSRSDSLHDEMVQVSDGYTYLTYVHMYVRTCMLAMVYAYVRILSIK